MWLGLSSLLARISVTVQAARLNKSQAPENVKLYS